MSHLALFDLDNTLIDRDATFHAWATEFASARELNGDAVEWMVTADEDGFRPRDEFFDAVRERFSLTDRSTEFQQAYYRRIPELISPAPDVRAGLETLRNHGWRIGIITNGEYDSQLAKIRNAGLDQLVDAWCISADVGFAKPDQRIFHLAAKRCGRLIDDGSWMVGDSGPHDIAGARAVGMRTIWIRRGRSWNLDGYAPDHVIDGIADSFEIMLSAHRNG